MMLHTKTKAVKFYIICLFLLAVTNLCTYAQQTSDEYEDIFLYAQRLEAGGAYEQAELEYKRYIFLQDYSAGIHQVQAFTALAGLYEKNSQWELAAQTIQKAILKSQDDFLKLRHIKYLNNSSQEASLSENLFIFSYMNLPDFSEAVRQYACLCAIENDVKNGRTGYAEKSFSFLNQNFPFLFSEQEIQAINTSFEKINTYKPKKQMLAAYLSLFPGLGQLYAGDYKDSLNAFLLNGSIIAVSVYSIWTLDLWTFSLLEFNPLIHFMQGNIYNAQKDTHEYNTRHLQAFEEEILNIIEIKKEQIY